MSSQSSFFPVAAPDIGQGEIDRVTDAMVSTWISSTGKYLDEFCERFAALCGVRHAIPVANGTVALHVILKALGIGAGDEVIVPSMTYIATANCVTYTGATPVFAEVLPTDWGLDPAHVESVVSPRTKAIVAVHLYGHPANMDALSRVAERHGIALVEDAAEAPFAMYKGRPTGSLGHAASFSFFGNKVITCGEGGAITTNDDDLAAQMWQLRGQGVDPRRRYFFPIVGFNYRMTNVCAAILCGQLDRYREMLERRQALTDIYDEAFAGSDKIELLETAPHATRTPWLHTVLIKDIDMKRRDLLIESLLEVGVETRPTFIPIHTLPPYSHLPVDDLPVTNDIGARGLSVPTASTMSPDDAREVATRMLRVLSSA